MKRIFSFLAIFLAIAGRTTHAEGNPSPPPTRIGVILPLTGAFARFGAKIQQGINSYANPAVQFIFEDEGCEPRRAVEAYNKLARFDKVNLFIGPFCGSPQDTLAPIIKAEKKLALLGSSAPEAVFKKSGGFMFSAQHTIEAESAFLAQKLNELEVKNVVIILSENQFSRAHEAAFRAHYRGRILNTFASNTADGSELRTIALRAKKLMPEAFYVPDTFVVLAGLMKELATVGLSDRIIYSVYPMQSDDVLEATGMAGEKIVYSHPDIGGEDALIFFPAMASRLMTAAAASCSEDAECTKKRLVKENRFDARGTLVGGLILKTIRNGKFVPFTTKTQ